MRAYLEIWCEPNKEVFDASLELGIWCERGETFGGYVCHSFYFANRGIYELWRKIVKTLGADIKPMGYRILVKDGVRRYEVFERVKADEEFDPLGLDVYAEITENINRILEEIDKKIQKYEKRIKDLQDWAEGYRKERDEKLELLTKIAEMVAPFMPPEEDRVTS